MIVKTYKARTQEEAAAKMAADGTPPGHVLGAQSWSAGSRSCAAQGFVILGILCLIGGFLAPPIWVLAVVFLVIGLVSGRIGELTVTWVPAQDTDTAAPTQPSPAPPDAAARLASLKSLLDQGLLTPEEYEAKRAEILSQM
jgi:hypothetical protein